MEKLERVLAAEDNARSGVSRAADDAASIRAAGLEEARTLEARIAAETAETIARQRSEIVGSAEAEAARISQDAGSRIGASLDTAAGRLDAVVARALSALRG